MKLNIEELKTLIANQMKNEKLHNSLPDDTIEIIKDKILARYKKDSAQGIPDVVSEIDTTSLSINTNDRKFPDERETVASPENNLTGETTSTIYVDAGASPTEQISKPIMGYSPELPDILKKAEPAELFIFNYNDIGENGENLSLKPMRLMNDPDVKKSMNDLWVKEGKTKAEIYVPKFKKIGEIEFDYSNGISKFIKTPEPQDYTGGPEYKDNPYVTKSLPQIDTPTQDALETYVKSSVDLEKVVHDIVMDIVKNSLLTNTEKVINTDSITNAKEDIATPEDRPGYGVETAQLVKPIEESFELSMEKLIDSGDYKKIVLPEELNEAIKSGDKSFLTIENDNMQKWKFKDVSYYTPLNRLSKTKGYIKS